MKKKLLSLALILALAMTVTAQAAEQEQRTVRVSTVQELEAALQPNTLIILEEGTYEFEGALLLINLENVTIQGTGDTCIVNHDGGEVIVSMRECENVTFDGVTMGHEIPPGMGCTTGVIEIYDSKNIAFNNCDIYGCGRQGLYVENSTVILTNSIIRDCTDRIMYASNSNITFQNCTFSGNGYNPGGGQPLGPANIGTDTTLNFTSCTFQNNKNTQFATDGLSYTLDNCTFSENGWGSDPSSPFTIENNGWLTNYHGGGGDVVIPDGIYRIASSAFRNCSGVTSVTFPSSVTLIADNAFYNCTGLTNITIPSGVYLIGDWAFSHCSNLTSVTIPSSVTEIGIYAFEDCTSLTDIYYGGNEADWSKMSIGDMNDHLLNAIIHYNSAMPNTPVAPTTPAVPTVGGFTDVKESDYFAAPILWAVSKNITNGTTPATFSPAQTCNRGQVVTFLHRAMGLPAFSASNPFTDINTGEYYGDAVLWAVENGITSGTSATTFSPDAACNRGQVVTFLWRAAGSPEPSSTSNPFTDVAQSEYYYKAVLWAVENGITNGTSSTTFSPNASCTRGQVVTFLYNTLAD